MGASRLRLDGSFLAVMRARVGENARCADADRTTCSERTWKNGLSAAGARGRHSNDFRSWGDETGSREFDAGLREWFLFSA